MTEPVPTWEELNPDLVYSMPHTRHAEPTKIFDALSKTFGKLEPYKDTVELFAESLSLAPAILAKKLESDDVLLAWRNAFEACAKEDPDDPGETESLEEASYDKATAELVAIHGFRLALTSPVMFSTCFELNSDRKLAVFRLHPFQPPLTSNTELESAQLKERHDIIGWLAAFDFFGKAFVMEGWISSFAESLVPLPDPNRAAIKVTYGREIVEITQKAKDAMYQAIEGMSSRPPIYYNCLQVMKAVTEALGLELVDYSICLTVEERSGFPWDDVVAGERDTYPQCPQPSREEFGKVQEVRMVVKKEKDQAARNMGLPHGGVASYCIMKQRWKTWRDLHAIYATMYPQESKQTIIDRVCIAMKTAKSEKEIYQKLDDDIAKFLRNQKQQQRKRELDQKLAAKTAEEAAAKLQAQEARQKVTETTQEKQQVEARPLEGFNTGRATRVTLQAAKSSAIAKAEAARVEAEKKLKTVRDQARRKQDEAKALRELKRKADQEEKRRAEASKKTRRNDTSRLDLKETPRQRGARDAYFNPPLSENKKFNTPGDGWVNESSKKLRLLTAFRARLIEHELVAKRMTFSTLMELVDLDAANSSYNERVLTYILFLILCQEIHSDAAIITMVNMVEDGIINDNIAELAALDEAEMQAYIDKGDKTNRSLAPSLIKFITNLNTTGNGTIPIDKAALKTLGIDDTVSSLLFAEVFGSPELVVGLHARKILVALDMIDWEFASTEKAKIKMSAISTSLCKRSLATWLPKGEVTLFHDTMDTIGNLLSARVQGDWGKIKMVIQSHFSPKDGQMLLAMAETISQIYKATRSGGRARKRPKLEVEDDSEQDD